MEQIAKDMVDIYKTLRVYRLLPDNIENYRSKSEEDSNMFITDLEKSQLDNVVYTSN